ncbi:MAG: TIGR02301 family protein [Pseudomonadota bacterium]
MTRLKKRMLFAVILGFLVPGQFAHAQSEQTPKIRVLPPAYNNQMMRLSEILGALHYLRELCGAEEGQLWRNQMSNLIETEEPTEERRAQMIARFNQGFRGFQETYRKCTPAAIEANNRYIAEGGKLASEIPSRFGR